MSRKETLKLLVIILVFCSFLLANQEQKNFDAFLNFQKHIISNFHHYPLADKKYGIEPNILRLLYTNESVSFSGGFSLFDINRNAEIAFPVFYEKPKNGITKFTTECHYRHFLGKRQNGFYVAGFTRLARLKGAEKLIIENNNGRDILKGDNISHLKLGVGMGIGLRLFSPSGVYWGCSLNVGRYLLGKNDIFFHDALVDSKYILSAELLKFGVAF